MRKQPTITLNLSNFRAYANGTEKLTKLNKKLDVQPSTEEDTKRFKQLKVAMRLIRQTYLDDGSRMLQVCYIHPETFDTLKRAVLFPNINNYEMQIKIKYRNILVAPGEGVNYDEVHGEG